jgi:hypothetical protein
MIDEKDLEIARLKGKIEALESELAKERALRILAPPQVPTFVPYPLLPPPLVPNPFVPSPIVPTVQPIYPQWPYDHISICAVH